MSIFLLKNVLSRTMAKKYTFHIGVLTLWCIKAFPSLQTSIMMHYALSIIEPQREETYLLKCSPRGDSNQPAHPHCLTYVFAVRMMGFCILGYPKMRTGEILIRLRECAGWSESSLGTLFLGYASWRCGAIYICLMQNCTCYFYALLVVHSISKQPSLKYLDNLSLTQAVMDIFLAKINPHTKRPTYVGWSKNPEWKNT